MYRCFGCGEIYTSMDEIRVSGDALSCKQCGGRIFIKEGSPVARRVKAR